MILNELNILKIFLFFGAVAFLTYKIGGPTSLEGAFIQVSAILIFIAYGERLGFWQK
ncbi:Uncharacterised protein [uncultured archaeon]|nr:Uncharacterised protein [uncultured archaeon]